MPRGGKRLGAGRKPKSRLERWLGGVAGHRPLSVVPSTQKMGNNSPPRTIKPDFTPPGQSPAPEIHGFGSTLIRTADLERAESVAPAGYLTDTEKAYWEMWAPLAIRRGMLTEDTRPGFAELCQVAMRKAQLWATIEKSGLVHEITIVDGSGQERHELKKHPLLSEWRGLVKQTELLMSRFGLTGDGKVVVEQEQPDDERAELARLMSG